MDLNDIPIEMLEQVFKCLDRHTLKISRLVCTVWNKEIISHGSLGLTLQVHQPGNIEFFNIVNTPSSLLIIRLGLYKYPELRTHCLKTLKRLSFMLFPIREAGLPVLNLKFFSYYAFQLTELCIYRGLLSYGDLELDCGGAVRPSSLFLSLKSLSLDQNDRYSRCDGKKIRSTSKNIEFLLKSIGTKQLTRLRLSMNESYVDINSCIARQPHRFEDFLLPEFICRQRNLQELRLSMPPSMPGKFWTPKYPFPTGLKTISVESRSGDFMAMDGGEGQILVHLNLLQWDPHFYDKLDDPMQSYFWKSLLLAQTKLESLYFINFGNFGQADIPSRVMVNNFESLKKLILGAKLVGVIDGALFQGSGLGELCIFNHLYEEQEEDDENQCWLVNVRQLPATLQDLTLRHVTMSVPELMGVTELTSLTSFDLMYDENHYIILQELPGFEEVLKRLLRMRSLKSLAMGQLYRNIEPTGDGKLNQMLEELDEWIDDSDLSLRIE